MGSVEMVLEALAVCPPDMQLVIGSVWQPLYLQAETNGNSVSKIARYVWLFICGTLKVQ